jgi:hypothetical protein
MIGKTHTTNYVNTFIQVAEDCVATRGEIPPERAGKPTIGSAQYAMLMDAPYYLTSDDVIFATSPAGRSLDESASPAARRDARLRYFAKGQACLRASPLGKQFGWGIHADGLGRVAIFAVGSEDYRRLANDLNLKQLRAMRSKRVVP